MDIRSEGNNIELGVSVQYDDAIKKECVTRLLQMVNSRGWPFVVTEEEVKGLLIEAVRNVSDTDNLCTGFSSKHWKQPLGEHFSFYVSVWKGSIQ